MPSVAGNASSDSNVLLTVTLSRTEFLHALRGSPVQIPLPVIGEPFGHGLVLKNYTGPELEHFRKWFFSRESYTLDLPFLRKPGTNFHIQASVFSLSRVYPIVGNAACVQCSITENGSVFSPQIGAWTGGHDVAAPVATSVVQSMYRFTAERFSLGSFKFGDGEILLPNASNLAEVLGVLRTNDGAFDRYNDAVRRVLPQIWRVNVLPQGNNQRILIWGREALEKVC